MPGTAMNNYRTGNVTVLLVRLPDRTTMGVELLACRSAARRQLT